MAYGLRNINILDTRPSIGIGVALPFNQPSAFKTVYNTKEQLKYNIINFLLTDKGERIFNPTFGAGLRSRLFEQITTESAEALEVTIKSSVEAYFASVIVYDVQVTADPDRSTIYVQFTYNVKNTGDTDIILLNLQNG